MVRPGVCLSKSQPSAGLMNLKNLAALWLGGLISVLPLR